jgi:ergothioneine biosynthesis protein EgtB
MKWIPFDEGIYEIGSTGDEYYYDNELAKHRVYINSFYAASRLITCGEYREFIEDDGYKRSDLWLSDGAAIAELEKWNAPLYWEKIDNEWYVFKLTGFDKINPDEPVTHISHYEADAFARWKGARLLTEFEWETVSEGVPVEGNFVEELNFNPVPAEEKDTSPELLQMFGDVWEWTGSAYLPYPGFKTPEGALGEYNGKFMSGQMVLRGGSCATSITHIRNTYRNFFPPASRWQFSGIRLAKDLK